MVDNLTFRYVTPVFRFSHFGNFEYSGEYKDAKYIISLKGYGDEMSPTVLPEVDRKELFKYAPEGTLNDFIFIHRSERFFPPLTNVMLVVDVIQPLSEDRKVSSQTREAAEIFHSILSSLRLHTSSGLDYEHSYLFREPIIGHTIIKPHTVPILFSHLGHGLSSVPQDQHGPCINTFEILLNQKLDESTTFGKILNLALDYHRTCLTLEDVNHAFLILMVAFEALFKKTEEKNVDCASGRIARLISTSRAECQNIREQFYGESDDAFTKLRNSIAHGDTSLDYKTVKSSFPIVYKYVTKANIALIQLPLGEIGEQYYDDLNSYVDRRFSELPATLGD